MTVKPHIDYSFSLGDTLPLIEEQLELPDDRTDLDGASVRFQLRNDSRERVVDTSATIEDARSAEVSYQLSAIDTGKPGLYKGEFEVTFPDGAVWRYPPGRMLRMRVRHGA